MILDEIPPLYRDTWAAYEALRKLGFGDDDVVFVGGPTAQPGIVPGQMVVTGKLWLHVVLEAQDKCFTITVGELDRPFDEAQELLERLRVSIGDGSTGDEVLDRMWIESPMGDIECFGDLCFALTARGFTLPALSPPAN